MDTSRPAESLRWHLATKWEARTIEAVAPLCFLVTQGFADGRCSQFRDVRVYGEGSLVMGDGPLATRRRWGSALNAVSEEGLTQRPGLEVLFSDRR